MVDNSKYTPNPRQYSKSNFVDLLELLTPKLYIQEDLDLSGTEVNPVSKVINSHLDIANNFSTVLPLSAVPGTQTSELSSLNGISQYFVKQNNLTKVTTQSFREKILLPLSANYSDYDTSAQFKAFLSSTLMPKLVPPGITSPGTIENNVSELSAFTNNAAASSIHNYLVDNLGWFYFLNTSALGGLSYSPSSFVVDNLSRLFLGAELETVDGIKGLTEYVWKNVETCSFGQYIPEGFVSGAADAILDSSAGEVATYTSGTQRLENLKTLIDVIYSPLALDRQDFRVKEAFDNFIDAQLSLEDRVSKGPYRKFLTALGFHFADTSDQVENIKYIYDIENVDQDKIEYIADLIAFNLRGNQSEKWRHQLRVATDIYKKSGTQQALRSALNAIVVDSILDVDSNIIPLWESYVPFLIWYSLGTASPLFKDLNTWTPQVAKQAGVVSYSSSSLEENLKLATDSILLDLASAFPKNFKYFGQEFPLPRFYYLNEDGTKGELYTVLGDTKMKPWHAHTVDGPGYQAIRRQAIEFGEEALWDRAVGPGPFGEGVYMVGKRHPQGLERPTYLLFEGDPEFLFNYRGKVNYPLPPFEEVKYYKDSSVTQPLVELLVDRLKCFKVDTTFADQVGDFLASGAVTTDTNIGSLNEFLMFFSSVQHPPNYDDVMFSISDYEKNLLSLWNGKSSHVFLDFDGASFDFRKSSLEADSKYALYETARVAQEYTPAHTIPRVNLNTSAEESYLASATNFLYAALDHLDTRAYYTSGTVLGNTAISGVLFEGTRTEDGFLTFGRETAENELSSVYNNFSPPPEAPASTARYIIAHDLSANITLPKTIEDSKQIVVDKRATRAARPREHVGSLDLNRTLSGTNPLKFIARAWMVGPSVDDPRFVDVSSGNPQPFYRFNAIVNGQYNANYWQSDSGDPFPSDPAAIGFSSIPNGKFGGVGADLELKDVVLRPGYQRFNNNSDFSNKNLSGINATSVGNMHTEDIILPAFNGDNNQVLLSEQELGFSPVHFNLTNFEGDFIAGFFKTRDTNSMGVSSPVEFFSDSLNEEDGIYWGLKVVDGQVTEIIQGGDGVSSFNFTTGDGLNTACDAIRFGIYRGGVEYSRYPYIITSNQGGDPDSWKLAGLADRGLDSYKILGPGGDPSSVNYRLIIKNLDSTGARIPASQTNTPSLQRAKIVAGSQWASNDYKISLANSATGEDDITRHHYRPGKYIWRNVEVDGRNTNEREHPWTDRVPFVQNPDMKWGNRGYSLQEREFYDCDFSKIKKEHCFYVATNGGVRVQGCTASSIGSQGIQISSRTAPYGGNKQDQGIYDYPTGDNDVFTSSVEHIVTDSHFVNCGEGGTRPAHTWTYFSQGTSQYPATLRFMDSTIVERFDEPTPPGVGGGEIQAGGARSRKTFVNTGHVQGTQNNLYNLPTSSLAAPPDPVSNPGAFKDQFVRVPSLSATYRWNEDTSLWENFGDITGNMYKLLRFQNCGFHLSKAADSTAWNIRAADTVSFEHCAFIYDAEDPNYGNQDYRIMINTETFDASGNSELSLSPSGAPSASGLEVRYLTLKNNIGVVNASCQQSRVLFRVFKTKNRGVAGSAENNPVFDFVLTPTNNLGRVITYDLASLDPFGGSEQTPTIVEDRAYDVAIDGPYPTPEEGSGGDLPDPPLTDPPGKIVNPYPTPGQTGVSVNVECAWVPPPGPATSGYDIYFGEGSIPEEVTLADSTDRFFDPTTAVGPLSYDTTYYWRVDAKNSIGTTTGDQLTFTTESAPPPAPGQATNFTPSSGATGVSITQACTWDAATNASSYDVYFGTSVSPSLTASELTALSFDPGELAYSNTYYWRIDPRGPGGVTTGSVISFTTEDDPGSIVNPPDEVTVGFPDDVEVSGNPVLLSWTAPGNDPSGYDVFFGTVPGSLHQVSTDQTLTRYETSSLSAATTYYWDVTAKNSAGTTPMTTEFEFSTLGFPGEVSAGSPNLTEISPINPVLSWEGTSATDRYRVYLRTDVATLTESTYVSEQEDLTYRPGNLLPNTLYYWSIESVNDFASTFMQGGNSEGGEEGEDPSQNATVGFFSFVTEDLPASEILRNDLRRRNFRYLLPEYGHYDRTGFNAPISYDPSVLEMSMASSLGELTLGYVASAGKFFPVEDHTNVSGVWHTCEGLQSNSTFSGVDTSNTFPYRGLKALGSDAKNSQYSSDTDRYVDRGQTPRIIRAMHSLMENKAKTFAEQQVSANLSAYSDDAYWKDQVQSFANSAIASGYVINSYSDYENFSFGQGMQKLYRTYCDNFNRHDVGPTIQEKTGGNIFAHVFGKALFNGDFETLGDNGRTFVQTTLRDNLPINNTNVWADGGTGTVVASGLNDAVVPLIGKYVSGQSFDYRNATILSGIEFCDISGAPSRNEFRIINLGSNQAVPGKENYFVRNPVVKCKSVGGLPRLRFDVSSYDTANSLTPEHKFKLKVKSLVADERKGELGGGQLGVWIHTEPASGLMWSWTQDGQWTPTEIEDLSINQVTKKLCHRYTFQTEAPDRSVREYCVNSLDSSGEVNDLSLTNLKEEYFKDFEIQFDTRNFTDFNNFEYKKIIDKNNSQYKVTDQVHKDRNYIIEVFFIPNNNDSKYLLIDSIELQDATLRYEAGISTGLGVPTKGRPLRPFVTEYKYELTKEQLASVLSFYNGLIGQRAGENTTPLASRDANITQDIMGSFGGSRINYRINPEWVTHTDGSNGNYILVEFDN